MNQFRRFTTKVLQQKPYSTTNATAAQIDSNPVPGIHVGILLTRKPMILKQLSEFSTSYLQFKQSQKLDEARPFESEFYFKRGTTAESRWLNVQKLNTNKHVPVLQPAEIDLVHLDKKVSQLQFEDHPQSLNRKMDLDLYLCIKNHEGDWIFPSSHVLQSELLHEACQNRVKDLLGSKIHYWVVGKTPIGLSETKNEKIFYMKTHILAGSIKSDLNHAWWTKEECAQNMKSDYYKSVCDMLIE
ncbi:hypothetical protein BC833DRAFT_580428 [Globomyces pollinis-pini]|nr:hypothetical protein BC833DRAFT_580428 [Globomyces pollinis-pini]